MEIDEEHPEEEMTDEEKRRAFNFQPAYKRSAVILAGSLMNLVLAVVLIFVLRAYWGEEIHQVISVNPNGPAWKGGIREGDVIWAIGDRKAGGMNIVEHIQRASSTHGGVKVSVERQGQIIPVTINPVTLRDIDRRFWDLGAIYYPDGTVVQVIPDSSARKMGLQEGDYVDVRDGVIAERLVNVEGEHYLALDVRRFDEGFTLAVPIKEIKRLKENFTGLGFGYNEDWTVVWVEERNPFTMRLTQANLRGVKVGDEIVSVTIPRENSKPVERPVGEFTFGEDDPFADAANTTISITFKRGSQFRTKTFDSGSERRVMGIGPQPKLTNVVQDIDQKARAFKAGMRNGDQIISIGNEPVEDGLTIVTRLLFIFHANKGDYRLLHYPQNITGIDRVQEGTETTAIAGEAGELESQDEIYRGVEGDITQPVYAPYFEKISPYVTLKVNRDGKIKNIAISLYPEEDEQTLFDHLGFGFGLAYRPVGFFEAWGRGFAETGYWIRNITESLNLLLTKRARIRELTGPLGILTITYRFAESGLKQLINIVVLITVNLAIINLLPIPALDGGRMVFLILEMVLRRPVVSVKVENIIHLAGILLLLIFILYLTFYDIIRISQW
jgi:membrane-associated protease RseP (regulator of RpoE activity)